jgi:hypothetical protein
MPSGRRSNPSVKRIWPAFLGDWLAESATAAVFRGEEGDESSVE